MRAQAAFEYMLIVIIALAFMTPVWIYISAVKTETYSELSLSYAKNSVDKLASTSDLIYSQGSPAKVVVAIYIPTGVEGFDITNNTVNLKVRYMDTITDVFAESRARMNGTLPTVEGNYNMIIEAVDNVDYDVWIQAA